MADLCIYCVRKHGGRCLEVGDVIVEEKDCSNCKGDKNNR